ncbi:hypothetical protein [Desulfonatronum thiodismutans]|uniref:hypothetical protein n=1 Tax=Desulfonatronum thiodismutans TaxID=159290 RepID=UPI0004ABE4D2|nr:hypothetical protein [Desulfonatronum thiodismutans]
MTHQSPLLSESDFASHHHQHLFHVAGEGYFLTWFDRDLEQILDQAWRSSPSAAFALHQQMARRIMETLVAHIPQVHEHGCAPLPPWTQALDQAMVSLDVRYLPEGGFNRAYAVLTFWPWRNACAGCALRRSDHGPDQWDCEGRIFDVRNFI